VLSSALLEGLIDTDLSLYDAILTM
jgi:hypothetical protein